MMLVIGLTAALLASIAPDSSSRVVIPRAPTPPHIDGVIEEQEWRVAARLGAFTQVEPQPGMAPHDSTVAYAAYDGNRLYIAVIAFGTTEHLRSPVTPRDQSFPGFSF